MSLAPGGLPPIQVLSVASEMYPLVKTGGLADVTGALPAAVASEGVAMRTLLPGYPAVTGALAAGVTVHEEADFFGGSARILAGEAAGAALFVLDAPHLYARPGNPYAGPDGRDWPDNPQRYAALAYAAGQIGRGAAPGYVPDIVHAHDWQAGLAAAYLRYGPAHDRRPATVMTVHNLAFQGQVPSNLLASLRLPPEAYSIDGVEYYQSIGMLKAGLALSDRITTVSPGYAREICAEGNVGGPGAPGMGLGGLLRARAGVLTGILNGIDTGVWNPSTDTLLAAQFGRDRLEWRGANKAALQEEFGLDTRPRSLLFGVVSRLTHQKGMDFVLAVLPSLLAQGAQLAVLGAGDQALEAAFVQAAEAHPGRVGLVGAQSEALAHLMQGGADAILVPSRFEPCGLTQLCALRYGAVPVVSRVGGLADTVIDANEAALAAKAATGIVFDAGEAGLESGLRRAEALWRSPEAWNGLQRAGMASDVSWRDPARQYAQLYAALAAGQRTRRLAAPPPKMEAKPAASPSLTQSPNGAA